MASIKAPKKLKNGQLSFQIVVYLGRDPSGKAIVESENYIAYSKAPTKAQKEAEAFACEFERKVLAGEIGDGDKITFTDFVEIWKKNWLVSKTPNVRENYVKILNRVAIPRIGMMKLAAIRPAHIDMILNDRKAEGKAAATVRKDFTPINSVFKYAVKKQYIRDNPCDRRDDLPTVKAKGGNDIMFFTEDQARRFLKDALTMTYKYTCKEHKRTLKSTGETYTVPAYTEEHTVPLQWRVYFTLSIYGMFRRGEICALTWADLDMKKHIVSITKSVSRTKETGQFVKEPKTAAGVRDLVLPADCFVLLSKLKMEQLELMSKLGSSWKGHRNGKKEDGTMDSFDDNAIFIQPENGLPIDISTPGHKFREILNYYNGTCEKEEDKLPLIRLHDLRHTGATLLLASNVDIETVSRRLGHSKASVTLDVYGHALPENDKKAADLLGNMFHGCI